MKTTSKVYPGNVLSKNSMYMTTDGKGYVLIHSEKGKKSERIRKLLSDLGVEFSVENYSEEMVDVDDYNNQNIEDDYITVKVMEMLKFKLKIDDLRNDCSSLYFQLLRRNEVSQMVCQYLTENNLLDGYVLN